MEIVEDGKAHQVTTLSFSQFGRTLEKTSFQGMTRESNTPSKQQHLFTIFPQQKIKDITQQQRSVDTKPVLQQKVMNPTEIINSNFIFKSVERSKGTFIKGAPSREKPIEPRYHPKYEMLYPHTRQCYIQQQPSVRQQSQNMDQRPISQTVQINRTHIQVPTPLHLQTNRKPLINKTFYLNESFDYYLPKTSQTNRSHSFNSYQAHQTNTKMAAMPEYDVFESWNRTFCTKPKGITFAKTSTKITPKLRDYKNLLGQTRVAKSRLSDQTFY